MTCSSCVSNIETKVKQLTGIHSVLVGLLAERAEIEYIPAKISEEEIVVAIKVSTILNVYLGLSQPNKNVTRGPPPHHLNC